MHKIYVYQLSIQYEINWQILYELHKKNTKTCENLWFCMGLASTCKKLAKTCDFVWDFVWDLQVIASFRGVVFPWLEHSPIINYIQYTNSPIHQLSGRKKEKEGIILHDNGVMIDKSIEIAQKFQDYFISIVRTAEIANNYVYLGPHVTKTFCFTFCA